MRPTRTRTTHAPSLAALLVLALAACGPQGTDPAPDGGTAVDAGAQDAGAQDAGDVDAGPGDAGEVDAGPVDAGDVDAGPADAGDVDAGPGDAGGGVTVPLEGFGVITGDCGVLEPANLESPDPALFTNHLDFGTDPYDDADLSKLTLGGQEVITDGNAGGSSLVSEAFAFEVLARCELASLIATEMEITYTDPHGKITDLLVDIDGLKIGVSVTRAIAYPFDDPYPLATAQSLLEKKLQGILDSTANVAPVDAWEKQILEVLAYSADNAAVLEQAWDGMPADLKADTILYVTVTDGDDAPLY